MGIGFCQRKQNTQNTEMLNTNTDHISLLKIAPISYNIFIAFLYFKCYFLNNLLSLKFYFSSINHILVAKAVIHTKCGMRWLAKLCSLNIWQNQTDNTFPGNLGLSSWVNGQLTTAKTQARQQQKPVRTLKDSTS